MSELNYNHVTVEENGCDLETFKNKYFDTHTPVLIKGGIKDWPAYKKWDIDYLIETVGDYQLEIRERDDRNIDDYDGEEPELDKVSNYFRALKDESKANEIHYARQSTILPEIPALRKDIMVPPYVQTVAKSVIAPFIPENEMRNPVGWFGPKNTYSHTHWDMEHNIFAQVKGSKRFILVSPDESVAMVPHRYTLKELGQSAMAKEHFPRFEKHLRKILKKLQSELKRPPTTEEFHQRLRDVLEDKHLYALCEIILQLHGYRANLETPDYEQFPQLKEINPLQAIVEAGDILYVPLQWRHCVRSLSTSFSLNWFFLPSINEKINPRYIILQSTLSHLLAE